MRPCIYSVLLSAYMGVPLFAQPVEPRTHAVPPACRGNLKEGVDHYPCPCAVCPVYCHIVRYTNCLGRAYELPPSFRFPPLREGNRWLGRVPSLREGSQAMRPFSSPCGHAEP